MAERRDFLTTSQVAARIGVSARTVAGWVRDGKIRPTFVTVGGHARFEWDDFARQLAALRERDG